MEKSRIIYWLTAIGAAAAVLQWAEQSKWLPQWLGLVSSVVSFDTVTKLVVFAILLLGAVRLAKVERQLANMPTRATKRNEFTLLQRLDDGRHIVELGDDQHELDKGAFEYYSECNAQQKAKIISAIRTRLWHPRHWDKDDFVLIVDEKEFLRRGVASLIQKGNEIQNEIHLAPRLPKPKEPSLSLLTSIPPAWRNHLTDWQRDSRKWLEKHIPSEAPAFDRPPQFAVTGDEVLDGLAELNDYRERLTHIQNRI
jgi:hypothetical protein